MKNSTDFAILVQSFLTNYLPFQRNYSINTVRSYKDALKLFVRFINEERSISLSRFYLKDFSRNTVIDFLDYIRRNKVSNASANQRLAALKTFASYVQTEDVSLMANMQDIITIKSIRENKKHVPFLSTDQIKLIINAPDLHKRIGLKHHVIMGLLYDTGARVTEICDLRVGDVQLNKTSTIKITGKGNKTRTVFITSGMSSMLDRYLKEFHLHSLNDRPLFESKFNRKYTRDGVRYIVEKYANIAAVRNKIKLPKIHPHLFRHTKAMHMLDAGIPLEYIRDFLGHEDISTTLIYAKASNKAKENAINKLAPKIIDDNKTTCWTDDNDLMEFLNKFG